MKIKPGTKREIKFICNAVRWFDRQNGNTYHSVRITNCKTGQVIVGLNAPYEYGYSDQYRYTALDAMAKALWLPKKYRGRHDNGFPLSANYERENAYPIYWDVKDGLKRDMIANGTL